MVGSGLQSLLIVRNSGDSQDFAGETTNRPNPVTFGGDLGWSDGWAGSDQSWVRQYPYWPLQVPAVFCAVTLLAGELASMPLRIYSGSRNRRGDEAPADHRMARMLSEQWSDDETSFMSRYRLLVSTMLIGRGYAFVERLEDEEADLHVLDPRVGHAAPLHRSP